MNTAKKAFIMAAGFGSRLRPATLHTPKPLVRVNGVRIIDTAIRALHENGIYEIYVVTGYLAECFAGLEREYPGVRVLYNPDYAAGNSITSLYHAREHLGACVIMDGDIIIRNPKILTPEFEQSCYCCMWMEDTREEWILRHRNWIVTDCLEEGGTGWALRSISLWTEEDALRMKDQLTFEYEHNGLRNVFWDYVPMLIYPDQYTIGIRRIREDDMTEIDSFEDLCRLDPSYQAMKEG